MSVIRSESKTRAAADASRSNLSLAATMRSGSAMRSQSQSPNIAGLRDRQKQAYMQRAAGLVLLILAGIALIMEMSRWETADASQAVASSANGPRPRAPGGTPQP
eukprot:TRINITY_DN2081_c0_g1_i2.p1 TRINITY_DN2081_c0_g1~~TRINITY_DN2081_c0_g1_i2.p1  ORF type:complete len:105 (+),score=3.57 TRINITY_DN2081_c0_g1_i2:118-432(+)